MLYVSHENPAEKVYHRVGYVGLCGASRPLAADDWVEIGFQVCLIELNVRAPTDSLNRSTRIPFGDGGSSNAWFNLGSDPASFLFNFSYHSHFRNVSLYLFIIHKAYRLCVDQTCA